MHVNLRTLALSPILNKATTYGSTQIVVLCLSHEELGIKIPVVKYENDILVFLKT